MFRRLLHALRNNQADSIENDPVTNSPVGSFDHFTDAVDTIKQLKREQRHDDAESLLLWCIEQAEQDNEFVDPPPWYYKHLAIVYRKDDRYEDEIQILERYLSNAVSPREDLQKRFHRAKELEETAE